MNLQEKNILLDIKAKNKENVLRELTAVIHQNCPQVDIETLFDLVQKREQIGSTGVGNGVAIPHARVESLSSVQLCFARTHDGVGFDSIDNKPVYFIVMILSPVDQPEEYLKTLGTVSRFLKKSEIRRQLRQAASAKEIAKIFQDFN